MATTTETGNGQHAPAANQVSPVQVPGAGQAGTDGEPVDAVSELGASVDMEDAESPEPPVLKEDDAGSACVEQEGDCNGTGDEEVQCPPSHSVLNPPAIMDTDCTDLFVSGGEPDKEGTELKTTQELKSETERIQGEDICLEKEGDHVIEDANTDTTCDTNEDLEAAGSKETGFSACELDEMMDIGTVDQLEQEALMEEEEGSPDEDDVKPSATLPPSELVQPSSSSPSESAANIGSVSLPSLALVNGLKVVKLSLPRLDSETLKAQMRFVQRPDSPPEVKVKDEPVDEEYDQALLVSSASTASVKDEPSPAKDLMIGSVYSVTKNSASPPPAATQTTQLNPTTGLVTCSHCTKSLLKGQTAFQRKGSAALFCSTNCLTSSVPTLKTLAKICYSCQKMILRPQDVILAPVDAKGIMKEFCGQSCLTSFNLNSSASLESACSMCSKCSIAKHEVVLNGTVHKLCSDACFGRFRTFNNLAMASCGNCGSYCHDKPLLVQMEGSSKPMCSTACFKEFKENNNTLQTCTMCLTSRPLAHMIDNKNGDGLVTLFCSSSCVMAHKVQMVTTSGTRVKCDTCGKNSIPSYHLAMSDTSIRNFCTLPCVMIFQAKFKKSQKQLNIFTNLPVASVQNQCAKAKQLQDASKGAAPLNCSQCSHAISSKPELIQMEDKMVFVCGATCSLEFKKANNVMSLCEYCKVEKMTTAAVRINDKDCYFCSDGCKLLFRHDLAKVWGKHCHTCAFCLSVSEKLVSAQYGGTTEEFCSDECRSRYTMLFCHVAKCDSCGRKGKLKQSLAMLGAVKHFCDLTCLLQFCSVNVSTQSQVVTIDADEATPIIANVVSLASTERGRSDAVDRAAQQRISRAKKCGSIGVQTDALPPPKNLKNKALLCKPLVQNKGVSCKVQTADAEAQTDETLPKVIVLPVPVPVYVPVPMNMYSQCTPRPIGLPLPLPVPMFLPVTLNSAERIVETIKEIKEKIPSDPFEAELILMAEMVAEQGESSAKDERPKDRAAEKERERQDAHTPYDHTSNYSDDLDTDELANFLNSWEDPSSDTSVRSPGRPFTQEKLPPILDVPMGVQSEPDSEPPPAAPPPMDIEADFTVETLERIARQREQTQRSPSPPPAPTRRRQGRRKARDKKKSQRSAKAPEASSPKAPTKAPAEPSMRLQSQYGIDAWKRWIQWRQTQPNMEQPRIGSRPMELKEDILRCTTAELSYGLCRFITEVRRPSGEPYATDSLIYLCLGIQQYLFENGRVENIFMDRFYNNFSMEFTKMLKDFKPVITARGYVHSRVEEEFLWECKQLGAYSPIVLLNTLLYFSCKYFGFTTVEQHRQLSFAHLMRCTKTNADNTKTTFLRFYPPMAAGEQEAQTDGVPAKKRKEEESKEEVLEMMENTENPLRCPVRLYEFYLSKCSESVKQRTNLFYLHPERCCVPNSPLWFSSASLDDSTMEAMLIRILTIRELHLGTGKE
ncbi:zinc finger MYM-type protein 4 [Genypterus blacodes]|uniref:zinc finger MYM-type protein 4 n=1 Tax=Genypterus blacodes TaxID=154954 RepID=UPI003F75AC90